MKQRLMHLQKVIDAAGSLKIEHLSWLGSYSPNIFVETTKSGFCPGLVTGETPIRSPSLSMTVSCETAEKMEGTPESGTGQS